MARRVVGDARQGAPRARRTGEPDLAMTILQYGTAAIAIVAVTLLAVVR